MLEYIPIPAIIIGSLVYAWWRKAYLTQVMVISNFFIFLYVFILTWTGNTIGNDMLEAFTFVPERLGDPIYLPSIITSMYMHVEPMHLIGNILILYLIGLPLEERIGSKNWGIIYFASGISATMLFFAFHPASNSHLLGASGAIFGLGGAFLILYPRDKIPMLLGPIFSTRAPVWAAVGIMFAMETVLVMMVTDDGVAHIAHIGGIVCGIFLAPMIVKKIGKTKTDNLNYELLRQMARKPEDTKLVDNIEK
ncbi:MAG: rhomboid family intramembrane serine protease, partial [Thermoplasmata archaeon]|nr:rhomboid family intramembrane serine protease [Thermoplasmata archaeon]